MTAQLVTEGIVRRFGGLTALDQVSFQIETGELVGLIGPNGSGKTTFLNVLGGFYRPEQGSVWFEGRSIVGREPSALAAEGIARSFQVTKIFRRISVLENLLVPGLTDWSTAPREAAEKGHAILDGLELGHLAEGPAASLSGGQAKLLEFGRIMMLEPKLVLLDEPVEGVAPLVVEELGRQFRLLKTMGLTILFSEQNLQFATDISDRAYIIEKGRIRYHGTIEELERNRDVQEKYLMI